MFLLFGTSITSAGSNGEVPVSYLRCFVTGVMGVSDAYDILSSGIGFQFSADL